MRQQNYFVDQSFTLGTLCEYQKRIFLLEKGTSKHLPTKLSRFTIRLPQVPLLIVSTHPKSQSIFFEIELVKVRHNSSGIKNMNEFTVHLVPTASMNIFTKTPCSLSKIISIRKLYLKGIGELH